MAITFKYKRVDRPPPLEPIHSPSIPITLRGPKESIDVVALVDSGADTSAIPNSLAEILGLDLTGEPEDIVGIGGKSPAVKTSVYATIQKGHEKYSFQLPVYALLEKKEDFPVLLGRQGFFDNFDITFKEKERKIILKKTYERGYGAKFG